MRSAFAANSLEPVSIVDLNGKALSPDAAFYAVILDCGRPM
jgi:hypothetical protein